ncbi:MAG: GTP-binding protein [Clostridia bacterium]|nr:GTP-binding protein [Clostridia bacterium]
MKTIPITLITGYLGSGKTTLINHLLKNTEGYKMAVIVNDIGEVNIDASLIENGGIVTETDENLVALQNGCICCTLRKDLIEQLAELCKSGRFDHIMIEASGICEPIPIAQTITWLEDEFTRNKMPKYCKLDAVISVTDALRLADEFGCGETLQQAKRGEEDIENLVIQQIEFCDIILLNKASEVSAKQLSKIKSIIKAIQPSAEIIETDYCDIEISRLLDTNLFDFEKAATSAGWMEEFDSMDNEIDADDHDHHHDDDDDDDDDDHEEHEGAHHHHHHHHEVNENDEEGTADEYDIGTFVYFRRRPFDRKKFERFASKNFGRMIIRTKGLVFFSDDMRMSYIYEQAGKQKVLSENGEWYATLPQRDIDHLLKTDARFAHDWDEKYGDRMIKLVFIGQNIDRAMIKKALDEI